MISDSGKILHLILKKKWFDLIASGRKVVEFRECKPYWQKRLTDGSGLQKFDEIHFRNGYAPDSPLIRVRHCGTVLSHSNYLSPENGEELEGKYFALLLGEVLEVRRNDKLTGRGPESSR